ncbi:ALF repeat-containing protein [Streptomyces litmocidini]|uniref:ALF repeat-containing protein n=1 Tax=Streptomyces litmocidini TaxID=67318 RepID=A0ABW7U307_9ACTN
MLVHVHTRDLRPGLTLLSTTPARADEPGDDPTDPWKRTLRISLGVTARENRCIAARFVHLGGPESKAAAGRALAGTDADVAAAISSRGWLLSGPLGQALDRDKAATGTAIDAFRVRQQKLDTSNSPYRSVNSSGGRDFHAPAFGADILGFAGQSTLWDKIADDPRPDAGYGVPGQGSDGPGGHLHPGRLLGDQLSSRSR